VYRFIKKELHERRVDLGITPLDKVVMSVSPRLLAPHGKVTDAPLAEKSAVSLTLEQLLDVQGTGRISFRNTRRNIAGFPERKIHLAPLPIPPQQRERILAEIRHDLFLPGALSSGQIAQDDPRVLFLVQLIKDLNDIKIIVICTTKNKAENLQQAIMRRCKIAIALFHEEMTILQRDRNAAWFAEEHGARLLISSEIGSEGRNFQFCQHLVLFDLPLNPEILDQRIGRLDRIGQRKTIHLHVPYFTGSPQETLCRWYHEGLDSFNRNSPAASGVFEVQREALIKACAASATSDLRIEEFLNQTRALREECTREHYEARDSLFEMLSYQPGKAQSLIAAIHDADRAGMTERIMHRLFKHYGIVIDEAGDKKHALITDYVTVEGFPLPRNERPVITFDRQTALAREDVEFLTLDHPMVAGSIDLYCASDHGTTAFATWNDSRTNDLLLESVYVVECIAPPHLNGDRFLPPSPLRIVVNHTGAEVTDKYPAAVVRANCSNEALDNLPIGLDALKATLAPMLEKSNAAADSRIAPVIDASVASMKADYEHEIGRLRFFQEHKGTAAEIERLSRERDDLEKYLRVPQIRLDAIRVIWRGATKSR
jgi:ATP-dependent helicase HepA